VTHPRRVTHRLYRFATAQHTDGSATVDPELVVWSEKNQESKPYWCSRSEKLLASRRKKIVMQTPNVPLFNKLILGAGFRKGRHSDGVTDLAGVTRNAIQMESPI
jgi:hypothetical protein